MRAASPARSSARARCSCSAESASSACRRERSALRNTLTAQATASPANTKTMTPPDTWVGSSLAPASRASTMVRVRALRARTTEVTIAAKGPRAATATNTVDIGYPP